LLVVISYYLVLTAGAEATGATTGAVVVTSVVEVFFKQLDINALRSSPFIPVADLLQVTILFCCVVKTFGVEAVATGAGAVTVETAGLATDFSELTEDSAAKTEDAKQREVINNAIFFIIISNQIM
jgi:hypothetical protein